MLLRESRQAQTSEFYVLDADVRTGQQIGLVIRGSKQLIRHETGREHTTDAAGWTTAHQAHHVHREPFSQEEPQAAR